MKDSSSVEDSFRNHTDLLFAYMPYAAIGVQIPVEQDVFFVADIKQAMSPETLDMMESRARLSADRNGETRRVMFGEHFLTDTGIVASEPTNTFRVRAGSDSFDTDLVLVSTDNISLDPDYVGPVGMICQCAATLASVMCLGIREKELRSELKHARRISDEISEPVHRLNNALQTVTGYSEMLLLKGSLGPEQKQKVDMILKGAVEIKRQMAEINAIRRAHKNSAG